MRVAIDATCAWNRRGFGRFTVELLHALARLGAPHRFTLLVDREPEPGLLPDGWDVVNAAPRRTVTASAVAGGRRSLRDLWAFTRAAHRLAPDVLFYPAVYSFFPAPPGTPAVVCFHDTIAESLPDLIFPDRISRWSWNAKVRLALLQATRLMTVSESSRQALAARFRLDPAGIDLVTEGPGRAFRDPPDAASVAACLARLGVPAHRPYLLHVGGLSPHKNLARLLQAVTLLGERADVSLVLTGDEGADGFLAEAQRLKEMAANDPRLRDRCVFTGYVSDPDLVALYAGAAALVFPSLGEGFGLPAVEAMACGVPVLASREGSLPEVVGDAGLAFDARDPAHMAAVMQRLLGAPDLRRDLAHRARARSRLFTWERAAEMALASLERAVG